MAWRQRLEQQWAALRFGEVRVENEDERHRFEVQVYLDALDPEEVRVELYADGLAGGEPERIEMARTRQLIGAANGYAYRAEIPAERPAADYTVRIRPWREGVALPLEEGRILWQR